jgi:hypothetical protein
MQCGVIGIESDGYFCNCSENFNERAPTGKNQPGRIGQYNGFHQRRQLLIQPGVG